MPSPSARDSALAKVIGRLKADPVLIVLASKTIEIGAGPSNKARVQRVKEVVSNMNSNCRLFEVALRRANVGGYGFRLGSSRSLGHVVAHVAADGPAGGLLIPGDMLLAVNDTLLFKTQHETVYKIISNTEKMTLLVGRTALARAKGTMQLTFERAQGELLGLRLVTDKDDEGNPLASRVQKTVQGSVAERAGFLPGDRVIVVNGLPVDRAPRGVVLGTLSGVVGTVTIDVLRLSHDAIPAEAGPNQLSTTAPQSSSATQVSTSAADEATAGPPVVMRQIGPTKTSTGQLRRTQTLYISQNMPMPKKHMFSRFRGAGGNISLPATFAISDTGRELAEEALACRDDGAYLFREAHGKLVLSVVHAGCVGHYTLQISLSQPYREVDKALRKFVKYYSQVNKRQLEKIGLLCPLREYVMGASSNARNLMQQLHAAGSTLSDDSEDSFTTQESADSGTVHDSKTTTGGSDSGTDFGTEWDPSVEELAGQDEADDPGHSARSGQYTLSESPTSAVPMRGETRLRIATLSILGETSADNARAVALLNDDVAGGSYDEDVDSRVDEDGLPVLSPTTDMFDLPGGLSLPPPPPPELLADLERVVSSGDAFPSPPPPPPVVELLEQTTSPKRLSAPPPVQPRRKVPPPVKPRQSRSMEASPQPVPGAAPSPTREQTTKGATPPISQQQLTKMESTTAGAAPQPAPSSPVPSSHTVGSSPDASLAQRSISMDTTSATGTPESSPKKPRRKLVRGGNKTETPVLPGYLEALKALEDLSKYLGEYEEMTEQLEAEQKAQGTAKDHTGSEADITSMIQSPTSTATAASPLLLSSSSSPVGSHASDDSPTPPPPPAMAQRTSGFNLLNNSPTKPVLSYSSMQADLLY